MARWKAKHPGKAAEHNRTYRNRHAERLREANRIRRDVTREQRRADNRRRYYADVEASRARERDKARRLYRKDPERRREAARRYRDSHPAAARDRERRWREANRDRKARSESNRRARNRDAAGSYTFAEWETRCAQFDRRCAYCGAAGRLTADHVVPLIAGGSNLIANIVPACLPCNSGKNDKPIAEWLAYRVRRGLPVTRHAVALAR